MKRLLCLGIGCAALLTLAESNVATAMSESSQGGALALSEAAAKASPELVGALSKELGSTPEQAAGAAGALFGIAQSRLKADEFSQISNAVPGMGALLKAAPAASGGLSQMAGSAAGLASAAAAFSKLGLKPELVAKAVPILTSFVTKSGGANLGQLLAGVLK